MLIGIEGIVQKSKKGAKLGRVSIKIVEVDDDGREVFEKENLKTNRNHPPFFLGNGKEGCESKKKGEGESTDSILLLGNASMHDHMTKPMDA
ncbi:hypothetical protein JHK82_014588 [Glycine max]|uniref:Uncharacterized protein n=2 Tax=Glycine subgen. Soja TaxID=1462606 RepID=A0A0R0JKZ3_SOYBN|nr:hypothetical protein JHK87_014499 [Glycine soja]KAG5030973.1 hypothetical protein JHK85_014955 [Glycine max]KAG5045202.1 hypothetical protein JHK86_014608 [Glycine max]KAG5147707.1 hypothetical protein JHK82_014588 [Glycine max]KAH1124554.1 hypothetical protein GYH30_014317 [Glycine max]